jgi:hypothetical protein
MKFDIAMGNGGKTFKELAAKRNIIAKKIGLQRQKTCIVQIFTLDSV